ncbi:MAG: formyltransferase family protein [Rhodospirillales bacterium]
MPDRIVLLSGEVEAPHLSGLLCRHNPDLVVDVALDADMLEAAFHKDTAGCRLIAFLTGVIVPGRLLSRLDGPAYNFHPGSPDYPGSYSAGFAIYDGAETFGVTLHEMTTRVDAGPIVEVRRFPVSANAKFQNLEMDAFKCVLQMFADYAEYMATSDVPLPAGVEPWTGRARTRKEAERLKGIEADLSEAEIVRRYRAFG